MTTAPAPATAAPGPEIQDPTLTQQLMLDAPWSDDLCIISARGTGKSWGIALVVACDAAYLKTKYSWPDHHDDFPGSERTAGMALALSDGGIPSEDVEQQRHDLPAGGQGHALRQRGMANTGAGIAEQGQGVGQIAGLFLDLRNP